MAEELRLSKLGGVRDRKYRPDIVTRVVDLSSEERAEKAANADSGLINVVGTTDRAYLLRPVVQFKTPAEGALISGDKATIRFSVRSAVAETVTVTARVDAQYSNAIDVHTVNVAGDFVAHGEVTVDLPRRDRVLLSLIGRAQGLAGEEATVNIFKAATQSLPYKPRLFFLGIGVGQYQSSDLSLGAFPSRDIRRSRNCSWPKRERSLRTSSPIRWIWPMKQRPTPTFAKAFSG